MSEASAFTSQLVSFLCEGQCYCTEKREAMTMKQNTRPKKCAEVLQDKMLFAKLSAGDVVAQKFKYIYHPTCPTALYNKSKQY